MNYLPYFCLVLYHFIFFMVLINCLLPCKTNLHDLIFYSIETPTRKYHEMASLWVSTTYPILYLSTLIIDFELLKFLCDATAIKHCLLSNSTNVFVMQINHYLGAVSGTETEVEIPECFEWDVIIVIFAFDLPRSMRCWN